MNTIKSADHIGRAHLTRLLKIVIFLNRIMTQPNFLAKVCTPIRGFEGSSPTKKAANARGGARGLPNKNKL